MRFNDIIFEISRIKQVNYINISSLSKKKLEIKNNYSIEKTIVFERKTIKIFDQMKLTFQYMLYGGNS